jgi:3-phosphoshikimate 1-carboxyvinyltransferase
MSACLAQAGAIVQSGADWMEVQPIPPGHAVNAEVDPRGDHRVAMSMAVLGMRTGGVRVRDPGCVSKSYPQFWATLGFLACGRAAAPRRTIE